MSRMSCTYVDIYGVWNTEGWIPPTVEERFKPDRTILTLAFVTKQAESGKNKRKAKRTSEKKNMIVSLISQKGEAKTSKIAEKIGLSQPRVRVFLSSLIEQGIIKPYAKGRA